MEQTHLLRVLLKIDNWSLGRVCIARPESPLDLFSYTFSLDISSNYLAMRLTLEFLGQFSYTHPISDLRVLCMAPFHCINGEAELQYTLKLRQSYTRLAC